MSLALTLNNALSGLRVNQKALSVLSQNIANANNADYSRKLIQQESQVVSGDGAGVSISDVTRKVDTYLQGSIQRQTSIIGNANTLADYATRLQVLLGKPGSNDSVDVSVTSFFNAMQGLSDNPESSSYKLNALNSGDALARRISGLVTDIQQLRVQADQDISSAATNINQKVIQLYDLNTTITNASLLHQSTAELLDKRDKLVRDISSNIDINAYFRPDGTVRLYTAGGATLLDDNYAQLEYAPANSPEMFTNNVPLSSLKLYRIAPDGNRIGDPVILATGGSSAGVTTTVTTGKIRAALDIRDIKMPAVLDQLDQLAAQIRDVVNAAHNQGSAYPGSRSLTGTRAVAAGDYSQWTGSVRIGLVDSRGLPIVNPYGDDTGGIPPLTLDLSQLNSSDDYGEGQPTIAAILKEINQYYAAPQNKFSLGNLDNIQLGSLTTNMPDSRFEFDFDLSNLAADGSQFFVSSASVVDDTGAAMGSVTNTVPTITLDATGGTYTTTDGLATVTIAATSNGLKNGDVVYLPDPGTSVNGIIGVSLTGYFTVSNVTANSFTVTAHGTANATGSQDVSGLEALTTYQSIDPGQKIRTGSEGTFRADLTPNLDSNYYDITVQMAVVDGAGEITTATVSYRVPNNVDGIYSNRYGALGNSNSGGTLTIPNPAQGSYLTATLVDADGRELQKNNGEYFADQDGYLKLSSSSGDAYIVIDSLDSFENGRPNQSNPVVGSGRGFSHYFELNNFFDSNIPTSSGDTVAGSAAQLSVTSRLLNNSGLLSVGNMVQSNRPSDPNKPPLYTYERPVGDNGTAHALGSLANSLFVFGAAGGLTDSTQTINGYAAQIIGFASTDANNVDSANKSATLILSGFQDRSSALSGVNLDEELANTIVYQNAYAASARIITVADQLFQTLLDSI